MTADEHANCKLDCTGSISVLGYSDFKNPLSTKFWDDAESNKHK